MPSLQQSLTASDNQHWHILGAGSIGCLFAYFLRERSTLLLKEETLKSSIDKNKHVNELHLTIEKDGEQVRFSIPASSTQRNNTIQNLLICTKANDTQLAIQNLVLAKGSNIVLLQNGMGNLELLEKHFPECSIFSATTTHGAFRRSDHELVHAGIGETYIGQINEENSSATKAIAQSLCSQDQTTLYDPEMKKRLWIKLAINCAINPLTAIYQCRNGELLENSEYHQHIKRICQELDFVLQKLRLLAPKESLLETIEQVARSTGNNYSSMYQDANNQRPSEIDFIQGYFCKQAHHLNIPTPENDTLFTTIKEIEARY